MNKLKGSIETLSALQLTQDIQWLDEQSKTVLHSKEVLAVILQGTQPERNHGIYRDRFHR